MSETKPTSTPATTTNTPAAKVETVKVTKPVKVWKYKLLIGLLVVLVLGMLAAAAYGGWYGYNLNENRKKEVRDLQDRIANLEAERDLNKVDLQKKIDELSETNAQLDSENRKLNDDLIDAKAQIDKLTPKNIKDLNIETLIKINKPAGDVWLNPIYADITGDGKDDGIYAYRMAGTGGFLNVYVYTYIDNTLTQILKAEEYKKGTVTYIAEGNTLEIKSEAGTPDAPVVASSMFKWDAAQKKMVKVN